MCAAPSAALALAFVRRRFQVYTRAHRQSGPPASHLSGRTGRRRWRALTARSAPFTVLALVGLRLSFAEKCGRVRALRRLHAAFGGQTGAVSRIIYTLVGIAGLWCITLLFREDGAENT